MSACKPLKDAACPGLDPAHAAGHRSPFDPATWLDRYGADLLRHAYSRLRDRHLAEDAVQETLAAALGAMHRYAGDASEKTWLVAILNHKILDVIRDKQRYSAALRLADEPLDSWLNVSVRHASKHDDPESAAVNADFRRVFAVCASRLPPNLYKAFVLHELHGATGEEASRMLGVSATNVWVMLHRARGRLAHCLTALGHGRPCDTPRRL